MHSLVLAALLLIASAAQAVQITGVQRGVQEGFELVIVQCDSLPDFRLSYDQIKSEFQLELKGGRIRPQVAAALERYSSGETISGVKVDRKQSLVTFHVKGLIYLREYLVSAPPALILDFSPGSDTCRRFPFELDREGYLKLGGRAEKLGKLDLALQYVDHVREWGESDPGLVHRAGVIEQRLGRWDLALEAFAKSSADPELAADAHARRTMIYMAQGDTLASGREWAGYFHRAPTSSTSDTSQLASATPGAAQPADTLAAVASRPAAPVQHPAKRRFPLQAIAEAGGGNSANYLYYGWGLLIVGLITLVGLWAGSNKVRKLAERESQVYRPFEPARPQSEIDFLKEFKPVLPEIHLPEIPVKPEPPKLEVRPPQVDPVISVAPPPSAPPVVQLEVPATAQAVEEPPIQAETPPVIVEEAPTQVEAAPPPPEPPVLPLTAEIPIAQIEIPAEEAPKPQYTPSEDAATVTHFVRFTMPKATKRSSKISSAGNGSSPNGAEHKPLKPLTKSTRIISASRDTREAPDKQSAPPPQSRIPTDKIVTLAGQGVGEEAIAQQLGVGRDEVAMVVNLSKAAR